MRSLKTLTPDSTTKSRKLDGKFPKITFRSDFPPIFAFSSYLVSNSEESRKLLLSANIRLGWELRKNIYFPRAQRAETGAERPLAALRVYSIRILSCFAGKSGGRGDYAELQMVSKLFSE